jgi:hypothetical protein
VTIAFRVAILPANSWGFPAEQIDAQSDYIYSRKEPWPHQPSSNNSGRNAQTSYCMWYRESKRMARMCADSIPGTRPYPDRVCALFRPIHIMTGRMMGPCKALSCFKYTSMDVYPLSRETPRVRCREQQNNQKRQYRSYKQNGSHAVQYNICSDGWWAVDRWLRAIGPRGSSQRMTNPSISDASWLGPQYRGQWVPIGRLDAWN